MPKEAVTRNDIFSFIYSYIFYIILLLFFIILRIGNIVTYIVNGHTPKIIRNSQIKESMATDGHIYVGKCGLVIYFAC